MYLHEDNTMNELVNLLMGSTVEETIVRVCIFLAIGEFISGIFGIIGKMKG